MRRRETTPTRKLFFLYSQFHRFFFPVSISIFFASTCSTGLLLYPFIFIFVFLLRLKAASRAREHPEKKRRIKEQKREYMRERRALKRGDCFRGPEEEAVELEGEAAGILPPSKKVCSNVQK